MSIKKRYVGFAVMKEENPIALKELCSMGGKAAHQKGTGHEWTPEEAREAGRKGGAAQHRNRKARLAQNGAGSTPPPTGDGV